MAVRSDAATTEPGQFAVAAKLLVRRVQDHDVAGLGAELAYRFLFAVFPFGLFVAALAAFIAGAIGLDNPTDDILAALGDNLPGDIAAAIRPELERVVGSTQPGLLSFGAIAALWAATGGINALMKGMNRAYDIEETRSMPVKILLATGLTLVASIGVIGSFVTVVGGALLTQQLANQLGVGEQTWALIQWLRWPIVFALLVLAVAILYRFAPNIQVRWRWILLGATAFAVFWILATAAFGFYVATFGNYGATYGALASVIVLMLWFYLTAVLLVGGAEVVAVFARVVDPSVIEERKEQLRVAQDGAETKAARDPIGRRNAGAEPSAIPTNRALVPVSAPRVIAEATGRRVQHGTSPILLVAAAVGLTLIGEFLRSRLRLSR